MKTLSCFMTVVCVMSWSAGSSAGGGASAHAEESLNCANFRCHFGDVPKADPPLIAEPFVSFYRDAVVKPMRPYHDWEPTAWRLPKPRAAKASDKAGTTPTD